MPFIAGAYCADPDQQAHQCSLIRIGTVHFLARNNLINKQKINSVNPDQMANIW
jgi:hypothetical protein